VACPLLLLYGAAMSMIRRSALALLGVAVPMLAACAVATVPGGARLRTPDAGTTVLAESDPVALAVTTTEALFASAPAVVLATEAARGVALADRARLPLLLLPGADDPADAVRFELDRLDTRRVLAADPAAAARARKWGGRKVIEEADEPAGRARPVPPEDLVVLATASTPAAAATARAAGLTVREVPGGDPRAAADMYGVPRPGKVLALGSEFGSPEQLDAHLAVAAAGVQLPGGGQLLFPGRRVVALYGHPGTAGLGVLGEQPVEAAVERARALAAEYDAFVDEPVVPAFELISTVADSVPGADGNFSAEAELELLRPWVDAAAQAGMYVLLDLQPGRADFLSQARRYTDLLAQPHVGLALDPEWRLGPDERPLQRVGSVTTEEVNAVATWLADLTRDRVLPQKLLMIHQFRTDMVLGRERLDTSRAELAYLIHADGFGVPEEKLSTWTTLRADAPAGVVWGWKNFYDEDQPLFTPQQTMGIAPEPPVFVSYQ